MTVMSPLPPEIVARILSYTSVQDVVRWRTVSKSFEDITHNPTIWEGLYMNAPFLLPRKSFISDSSEDVVVHSARLARVWTAQPPRIVSRFQVPLNGYATDCDWEGYSKPLLIIGGRWLLLCQELRRFVLYDISANPKPCNPQVMWEQEEAFSEWDGSIGMLVKGKWTVYVLLFTEKPPRWRLLEIHVDAKSGATCDTIDLHMPVVDPEGRPVSLDTGEGFYPGEDALHPRSPFIWITSQSLVLDTRTRIFYEFPKFHVATPRARSKVSSQNTDPVVVVTNTHIIALRCYGVISPRRVILVQAFTLPDESVGEGKGTLRLSHEGTYEYLWSSRCPVAMIQNCVVDPATGSTGVKLLERSWKYDGFCAACTQFTLHQPPTANVPAVAPLTVKQTELIIGGNRPPCPIENLQDISHDICDEGYARGFFTQETFEPDVDKESEGFFIKFELDATQDRCAAALSPALSIDWPGRASRKLFDGVRGRFYYIDSGDKDVPALTVIDIE